VERQKRQRPARQPKRRRQPAGHGRPRPERRNVLDFDGAADFMQIASGVPRASGYTAFVVGSVDSATAAPRNLIGGDNGSFNFRLGSTTLQMQIVRTGQAVLLTGSTNTATGTPYVYYCRSVSGGNTARLNGAAEGTNATNPAYSVDVLQLGASVSANFHDGVMGEVVIYSGDLTTAQVNQVGNYLAAKWGITWTAV
jgi:hypothetical protein